MIRASRKRRTGVLEAVLYQPLQAAGATPVATTIVAASPTTQSGVAGAGAAILPAVLVLDQFGNPIASVSVTFAVTAGGGSGTGLSATTDGTGKATVGSWTLGATKGINTMTATSGGLVGSPVTFTVNTNPLTLPRSRRRWAGGGS